LDWMTLLRDRYDRAVEASGSILCLGLDPPPLIYRGVDERLRFCLDMLERLAGHFAAIKVNENHSRGMGEEQHRAITGLARRLGLLSILDCKLGDIDESVKAGVKTVARLGYDAFTANPFFGNIAELVEEAHEEGLGVFLLVHPSGRYGARYFRLEVGGEHLFWRLARDGAESGVDGVVFGLWPGMSEAEASELRSLLGEDVVILAPGLGAQGGDPAPLVKGGGERLLFNVGRSVILADDPVSAAAQVSEALASRRESILTTRAIISTEGVLNVYDQPVQLSSGGTSRVYIDCRSLYSNPSSRSLIARLMSAAISRRVGRGGFDIATTATAGIPLASIVADRLGAGLVYVRMERKAHGLERRVEGVLRRGRRYVGVDDVATTGRSALECVKAIREEGGVMEDYFVIFDRLEGAGRLLGEAGVKLYSLARMDEEFRQMAGLG